MGSIGLWEEGTEELLLTSSFLTLGAHAQRGLQYFVCLCVCLSVTTSLAYQAAKSLKFEHR